MLIGTAIRHLIEYVQSQGAAPGTLQHYRHCLKVFAELFCAPQGIVGIEDMTHLHIRAYWNWLRDNGRAVPGYARDLNRLFNFLADEGVVVRPHVVAKAGLPRDKDAAVYPYGLEALEGLLRAARKGKHSLRDELLVLLEWDSGGRIGELLSIDPRNIQWANRTIIVRGKGGTDRALYYGQTVARLLRRYLPLDWEERDPTRNRLFLGERGPLTDSGAGQIYRRLKREAGITGRGGSHRVRHAHATQALENGMSEAALQRGLGHSTPRMTKRYTQLADNYLRAQHDKASPVDNRTARRTKSR
jgi:integrase/recombinase XerD